MHLTISKTLQELPIVDYRVLEDFQKNLKDLSKANYGRLKKSLTEFGFIVPLFVWFHHGKAWTADGHQRLRVLRAEEATPYELPYVEIEAKDVQEAKKKLLVISSQYGTITQEGMDEFTFDLDDSWKAETINFDKLNFKMDGPAEMPAGGDDCEKCPECGRKKRKKWGE